MILTRAHLLGANKRRYKNVAVPDGIELPDGQLTSGSTVRIRSLTEKELSQFEMSNLKLTKGSDKLLVDRAGMVEHRRRLLRLVLVDDHDNTLVTSDDDDALGEIDGLLAQAIYVEACKHCGMKERDDEPEKKDANATTSD